MNFKNIAITELLPDAKNPRKDLKPEDPEFQKINTSIEKFGFLEPIVFNTRTKKILGGHQRLKTLKNKGITELHILSLGAYSWAFTDDDLKELSPSEENAANIALNKAQGDWAMDQLMSNLKELKADDFDISLTGFDNDEFDKMISSESIATIDDLLEDFDSTIAIEKPIWIVIRASQERRNEIEKSISELKEVHIERSYTER